jgi:hypothetical protein
MNYIKYDEIGIKTIFCRKSNGVEKIEFVSA